LPAMAPLFLRRAYAPEEVLGPLTPDQILESGLSGDDCVSMRATDPFVPVERDLDHNDALRDALLHAFPSGRAARYEKMRFFLFAGLVPMVLLVVLDADLLRARHEGATAALAVDLLSALVVAVDLAHPHPRHPHVTAAAFGAAGLRFAQLVALRCAATHTMLLAFGFIAVVAAIACLVMAPTPRAVADHLRRALALAPPTRLPHRTSRGFFRYIIYAIGAAAALPALLWLLRTSEVTLALQLLIFVLFALIVPYVGRVFVGKEPPVHRDCVAGALGIPLSIFQPSVRAAVRAMARVASIGVMSLVLSFALVRGAQSALETTARVQHCVVGPTAPPPALQRLVDAQRLEVSNSKTSKDPSWLLLTVLVVPIAEELVYRGLVQHALRRRLKRRLAIGLAALLFGLAHLVVYQNAVYQPILLGLSFGLAYERAGILASILVHMLWNLWLSL